MLRLHNVQKELDNIINSVEEIPTSILLESQNSNNNNNQVNRDKYPLNSLDKSPLREKDNLVLRHDVIINFLTSNRTNNVLPNSIRGLIKNLEDRKDHI